MGKNDGRGLPNQSNKVGIAAKDLDVSSIVFLRRRKVRKRREKGAEEGSTAKGSKTPLSAEVICKRSFWDTVLPAEMASMALERYSTSLAASSETMSTASGPSLQKLARTTTGSRGGGLLLRLGGIRRENKDRKNEGGEETQLRNLAFM